MTSDVAKIGYRCGIAACAATVAFDVVQTLQLAGVLVFPWDEILIYGTSLAIVVPFMLEMLAFHHVTAKERRFWSHAALLFAVIYGVFVTANYVVQLATVIPAKLHGIGASVALLEQTPHSLFWDFDAVGYIAMGLAAAAAAPAIDGNGRERWTRRLLSAHALVTPLIAVVYFLPIFSPALLLLGLPWALTAPAFMFAVARTIRRAGGAPLYLQ